MEQPKKSPPNFFWYTILFCRHITKFAENSPPFLRPSLSIEGRVDGRNVVYRSSPKFVFLSQNSPFFGESPNFPTIPTPFQSLVSQLGAE